MKINEIENQLKKLQEEVEKLKSGHLKGEAVLTNERDTQVVNTIFINDLEWFLKDLCIIPSFVYGETVGVFAKDGNHYYNWYAANIIAREIGDGWRLPTKEELENLYKELGKDFYKVMKPELNGGCNSTGGLYNQGSYGYWWSSTPYSAANAYHMYFNSSAVHPSNLNSKYYGFAVRLVRETER